MTKAEAIAMLKRIQEPEAWEPQINQAAFEALDMAIKALEQQPCEDTISRQAAIDELDKGAWGVEWDKTLAKTMIESLPSAQPEIIRCKDCIYQTESWSGIKYCEAHGYHIGKDYDYCSNARRRDNG